MCNRTLQKIDSVNSWLQAAARKTALEQAGIPVTVIKSNSGSYLDLAVPEEFVYDALNLISPDCIAVDESAAFPVAHLAEIAQ